MGLQGTVTAQTSGLGIRGVSPAEGITGDLYVPTIFCAPLVELADTSGLDPDAVKSVGVQIPHGVPILCTCRSVDRTSGFYPDDFGSNPNGCSSLYRYGSGGHKRVKLPHATARSSASSAY